ncbi:alpha/beta fold hydrolase [Kribbella sandramycini]|uniref:Alpha/beta fold hydrolase n=1 Tax=Kribbella sandramycini TaxID=60450 RepID=A0A7Y4KYW5_9ACTN|nr:CocE/NonD family hydrolase [Kribbella sandramycini]MBB6568940.1 alpha/beta superfamily hydrolase [Kribbella sandramycini]NOL41214.1 alpha/beta fold hydrolase [Kribbella sandramycini]
MTVRRRPLRFTTHALTALVLTAAGLVPASAVAADSVTTGCVNSVPEPGSSVPVRICYSLFKPAAAASRTVPLIFHSHGWGGSRTKDAAAFKSWLDAGFGVLSFDQRSFGESTGVAHVMNPDYEGRDVIKLVDLVASLDWVTREAPGDPLIGAIGGSYGGGYQFAGAFTELRDRGRTRFDALAPEITWWDLKQALAPSEAARALWLTSLYAAGGTHLPPSIGKAFLAAIATGGWPTGKLGRELDAFFAHNGPAWHVAQGRRLDLPVLIGQGLSDNLFNLNEGLSNFARALTPAARAKSMLIGYNGGHTLPSVVPPGFATPGDPCSIALGSPSFADLSLRFMRLRLRGEATGLTGFGVHHLTTADGRCITQRKLTPNTSIPLGKIATPTGVGVPVSVKVASGPLTVAGTPYVTANVYTVVPRSGAFFALSVGTSPLTARVVQNNTMPLRERKAAHGVRRTIELPAIAVDVPAGKNLYLTVAPVADMYAGQRGPLPGALLLKNTTVSYRTLSK